MNTAGFSAATLVGSACGCVTGLLPGLHLNTVAVVFIAVAPALAPALGGGPEATALLAGFIVALTVAHQIINVVPSTFLGAPDQGTAASIQPAHRMLLLGFGFRAVRISAFTGFFAVAIATVLTWPLAWLLLGPPNAWPTLRAWTPLLLLVLAAFLVLRENARLGPALWSDRRRHWLARGVALALFLASGAYAWWSFRVPYQGFIPVPASPLLPMLGGLYGAASLVEAMVQNGRIPHQFLRLGARPLGRGGAAAAMGVGLAAGATMSLLPALTNASATAVTGTFRKSDDAQALVSLGAVGAANSVFNLGVLFLLGRSRSGAVVAVERVTLIEPWHGSPPALLFWLLFAALGAAFAGLGVALTVGAWAARRIHKVPYLPLVRAVAAYATLIVLLFNGWTGLLVFLTGAALGLVPMRLGLSRTHLTGVLLVPVLIYFWA